MHVQVSCGLPDRNRTTTVSKNANGDWRRKVFRIGPYSAPVRLNGQCLCPTVGVSYFATYSGAIFTSTPALRAPLLRSASNSGKMDASARRPPALWSKA